MELARNTLCPAPLDVVPGLIIRPDPVVELASDRKLHGSKIKAALKRILPHTDAGTHEECVEVFAGTHRSGGGGPIMTVPGADGYTGVAIRIFSERPGGSFIRIDELNVAKNDRRTGVGTSILKALGSSGLRIYHSTDLSRGWWKHMHRKHPELFNREDLMKKPARRRTASAL